MPTTNDINWIAGLLEGEGCFYQHNKSTVAFCLKMTDEDIVKRASTLLKGSFQGPHGPYGLQRKPYWLTKVYGVQAVSWMMTIYILMGNRRQLKIKELIDFWKTRKQYRKVPSNDLQTGKFTLRKPPNTMVQASKEG